MSATAFALNPEYHPFLGNDKAKPIYVKYNKDILKGLKKIGQRLLTNHGKNVGASKEGDDPIPSLLSQYAHYIHGNVGLFDFIEGASDVGAAEFYRTLGGTMPELAKVAKRFLSKGPAAAGCERNWSLYGGVVRRKHAKMSPGVARRVVFAKANNTLLYREDMKNSKAHSEEFLKWEQDIIPSDPEEVEEPLFGGTCFSLDDGGGGGGRTFQRVREVVEATP
ncbi:unnamed protein product [Discosporangium mesarthrocarpum]